MLLAPGPMEVVQAIMRRRACALAKAIAACAIACSLWARRVGSLRRAACSAGPGRRRCHGRRSPTPRRTEECPPSMCWAARKRTTASAIVMRTVATASPRAIYYYKKMIEIAQFGAGRIGQIHASNIAAFKDVRLRYVIDVNAEAAQKLAARYGAKVVSEHEAFADPEGRRGAHRLLDRHARAPRHRRRTGRQGDLLREADRPHPEEGRRLPGGSEQGRRADVRRLQPPLRPELQRAQAPARRGRSRRGRAGGDHQPRPGAAAARLPQGLGRHVPRHDDPRLRHGALAARRRAGRGVRRGARRSSTRRSPRPATSTRRC